LLSKILAFPLEDRITPCFVDLKKITGPRVVIGKGLFFPDRGYFRISAPSGNACHIQTAESQGLSSQSWLSEKIKS